MEKTKNYSPAITQMAGDSLVLGSKKIYVRLAKPTLTESFSAHRPFLEGMGSVINISGKYRVFDKYLHGSEELDMRHDWGMVGLSIREAMNNFKRK